MRGVALARGKVGRGDVELQEIIEMEDADLRSRGRYLLQAQRLVYARIGELSKLIYRKLGEQRTVSQPERVC